VRRTGPKTRLTGASTASGAMPLVNPMSSSHNIEELQCSSGAVVQTAQLASVDCASLHVPSLSPVASSGKSKLSSGVTVAPASRSLSQRTRANIEVSNYCQETFTSAVNSAIPTYVIADFSQLEFASEPVAERESVDGKAQPHG
jgi:hypothetical protein